VLKEAKEIEVIKVKEGTKVKLEFKVFKDQLEEVKEDTKDIEVILEKEEILEIEVKKEIEDLEVNKD